MNKNKYYYYMIKLCLTILIILCLIYLIYIKEQFTTCNSELVVNSLLINGSFNMKDGNPVANIFWKIPNGLKKDDVKSYFIIYKNVVDGKDVVLKIAPEDLDKLLHPRLDPKAEKVLLAIGLPASPGAASGQIVFDSETAQTWYDAGKKVILLRQETSP